MRPRPTRPVRYANLRRYRTVADNPRLVAEFDSKRNAPIVPAQVRYGSTLLLWWRCGGGRDHRWQASPNDRSQHSCPFCAGNRVSITNALATLAPKAAKLWDYTRNAPLTPRDVTAKSHRMVWWTCPRAADHRWQTSVVSRVISPSDCPFCIGRAVSKTNCLATVDPRLARQWDKSRNGKLTPKDATANSGRRVWWRCPRDRRHVWRAQIIKRHKGHGCPFCSSKRLAPGRSFGDLFPKKAARWHPTRNRPLSPKDVSPHSGKRVWWKCSRGPDHEWQGSIAKRTKAVVDCPFCSGDRLSITNCLATRFPAVARTWHPGKNKPLTPRDVNAGTPKKVWWICVAGHAWKAAVASRTRLGAGCPFCHRRRQRVATTRRPKRWVHLASDFA